MMKRSRSKRSYYSQDHENEGTGGRTKQRYGNYYSYSNSSNSNYGRYSRNPNTSSSSCSTANGYRGSKPNSANPETSSSSANVTTSYRILCHDSKVGGVIGKFGCIIKQIRQLTGAWINVHDLVPGDDERIIEISDTRRKDTDGRLPEHSPAESALLLIHERILASEPLGHDDQEEGEYKMGYNGNGGVNNRVATRMVVSRVHVGCLLGKGGKIIEQMRLHTKTQIRVLPRDHPLPRCISITEEIVQVVGDVYNVHSAVEIIAARLKESQHRDRGGINTRKHSPDSFFPGDDYVPHDNTSRRGFSNGMPFASRPSRSNSLSSMPLGNIDAFDAFHGEVLVFRLLCPIEKINRVVGESDGVVELLENEVGVDVKLGAHVPGSDEQQIIISSEEGPDDELFPAQEALLHIQTQIADVELDQENVTKTRLLLSSGEARCLEGADGSFLEMERATGAKLQLLAKANTLQRISENDELLQIEGEIRSARDALVEVTSRLRRCVFKSLHRNDAVGQEAPPPRKRFPKEVAPLTDGIAVPVVTRSIIHVVVPEQAVPKLITKSKSKLAQISERVHAAVGSEGGSCRRQSRSGGEEDRNIRKSGASGKSTELASGVHLEHLGRWSLGHPG